MARIFINFVIDLKLNLFPKGPWYCYECLATIGQMDELDPTLDFTMIEYLRTKQILDEYEPIDVEELKFQADLYYLENYRLREKLFQGVFPLFLKEKFYSIKSMILKVILRIKI